MRRRKRRQKADRRRRKVEGRVFFKTKTPSLKQ